jgi:adenine phosphoribosyltransferase
VTSSPRSTPEAFFAPAVALQLRAGVAQSARRANSLFAPSRNASLEYGTNTLAMHIDAIRPGQRVLLVDDVSATGGTAAATVALIERLGRTPRRGGFPMELDFLGGREKLPNRPVRSVIRF